MSLADTFNQHKRYELNVDKEQSGKRLPVTPYAALDIAEVILYTFLPDITKEAARQCRLLCRWLTLDRFPMEISLSFMKTLRWEGGKKKVTNANALQGILEHCV